MSIEQVTQKAASIMARLTRREREYFGRVVVAYLEHRRPAFDLHLSIPRSRSIMRAAYSVVRSARRAK